MRKLFARYMEVSRRTRRKIVGVILILSAWWLVTYIWKTPRSIFPSPLAVLTSFPELHFQDKLVRNVSSSLRLNLLGYAEAIAIAVPLGFIIGLSKLLRELFEGPIAAMRYLPLSAVTGLFILWLGIESNMKVQFLTLGIVVYLLPTVVERIDEMNRAHNKVHLETVTTLGASRWQLVKYVYIPSVLSNVFVDIGILVAISWTYIIIPEMVNRSEGGIGALIFSVAREQRADKVFACLLVICLIGVVQDRMFKLLDRLFFPHKYAQTKGGGE